MIFFKWISVCMSKLFMADTNVFVIIWKEKHGILLSATGDYLMFQIIIIFLAFLHWLEPLIHYKIEMMNSESRHSCLIWNLGKNFKKMKSWNISIFANLEFGKIIEYFTVKYYGLFLTCWESFFLFLSYWTFCIMKGYRILSNTFSSFVG